jgi:hypothetical protein
MGLVDVTVSMMLMNVHQIHASMVQHVMTMSTRTLAHADQDLVEYTVRQMTMIVPQVHVCLVELVLMTSTHITVSAPSVSLVQIVSTMSTHVIHVLV